MKFFVRNISKSLDAAVFVAICAFVTSIVSIALTVSSDHDSMKASARSELSDILLRLHEITQTSFLYMDTATTDPKSQSILQALSDESSMLIMQGADLVEILDEDVTETELYMVSRGLLAQAKFDRCSDMIDRFDSVELSDLGEIHRLSLKAQINYAKNNLDKGREIFNEVLAFTENSERLKNTSSYQTQLIVSIHCAWSIAEATFGDLAASSEQFNLAASSLSKIKGTGYIAYSKNVVESTRWHLNQLQNAADAINP